MKIAIFKKFDKEKNKDDDQREAYAFRIEGNSLLRIGYRVLSIKSINYIILWLLSKDIDTIYMDNIPKGLEVYLKKLHIVMHSLEEMMSNPLLANHPE